MFSLSGLSFSPLMAPLAILAAAWPQWWSLLGGNSMPMVVFHRGLGVTDQIPHFQSSPLATTLRQMADGCSFDWSVWTCWYELGVMSRGRPQNAVGFLIFSTKVARSFKLTVWWLLSWWKCSISQILCCSWFVEENIVMVSIWHIMAVGSLLLWSFVWSGGLPGLRNGLYRLPYRGFKGGVAQIFWMGRFTGSVLHGNWTCVVQLIRWTWRPDYSLQTSNTCSRRIIASRLGYRCYFAVASQTSHLQTQVPVPKSVVCLGVFSHLPYFDQLYNAGASLAAVPEAWPGLPVLMILSNNIL